MKASEFRKLIREEVRRASKQSEKKTFTEALNANQKVIIIDLYDGVARLLPSAEFKDAAEGLRKVVGKDGFVTYKGEEYLLVILPPSI